MLKKCCVWKTVVIVIEVTAGRAVFNLSSGERIMRGNRTKKELLTEIDKDGLFSKVEIDTTETTTNNDVEFGITPVLTTIIFGKEYEFSGQKVVLNIADYSNLREIIAGIREFANDLESDCRILTELADLFEII